jgi:hypothetical protein
MLFGRLVCQASTRFGCLFGGVNVLSRIAERGIPLQICISPDFNVMTALLQTIRAFFPVSYEVFGLLFLFFSVMGAIGGYSIAYNLVRKGQFLRAPLFCFPHDLQMTRRPGRIVRRWKSPEYN